TKAAAQRLQETGVAQEAGSSAGAGAAPSEEPAQPRGTAMPQEADGGGTPSAGEKPPRPTPEPPGAKPEKGAKS
ncbi:MAG: hypothetical protein WB507_08695, partial [Solirubrobacterales bacterium]